MVTKVAINGFGRIGRLLYRAALETGTEIDFAVVNDLTDAKTLAFLLEHDTVHGRLPFDAEARGDVIVIKKDGAVKQELKVLVSAPMSPAPSADLTVVYGVNDDKYDPMRHHIVSLASCTTNCVAPVAKVLNDKFGVKSGLMNTIHSVTNDQRLLDMQHKDLRRARSAAFNLIPTTTGAAVAATLTLPELEGRMNGLALRVPTPDVSIVDFTAQLQRDVTKEEVNAAFKEAAQGVLKGILDYTEMPVVSSDFIHNPYSAIVDGGSTMVIGNLVKVLAWYDNEWGYSVKMVRMIEKICRMA